jgi:hypothetical protein
VEFRKGVSGWLVVRDEITGTSDTPYIVTNTAESKGLVPEGYVRFLNDDEERQYLSQSPPSNTLLPRDQQDQSSTFSSSTGEETPRPPMSTKQPWIHTPEIDENEEEKRENDEPESQNSRKEVGDDWNVDGMIDGEREGGSVQR